MAHTNVDRSLETINRTEADAQMEAQASGWVGWVYFAGIMMFLAGIFHAIEGLVALFTNQVFVTTANQGVWVLDLTSWGWIQLLLGIVVAAAGAAVLGGRLWGRVVGIMLVFASALVNFAFIPVYPFWSIVLLVVDGLILWALLAHGNEAGMVE